MPDIGHSTLDIGHSGASAPSVLLVLAGPAGSGKTTLCERLVAEVPGFTRVITSTTRAPRPGEVNGVHYHFFSPEEFDARIAAGAFLEWAWVHKTGNRYGTLASSVFDQLAVGRSLIINVDVQGVQNFRNTAQNNPLLGKRMATVFINVPIPELRVRLGGRGETEAEIAHRMQTAERELLEIAKFDHVIESRDREADFVALRSIYHDVKARVAAAA
jgi:guanylate kinase